MIYKQIDIATASNALLYKISKWHNETRSIWFENYEPTEERIQETIDYIKSNDFYIAIAEENSVLGFIWAERQKEAVKIFSLYVDKSVRQKNVGTHLKKELETWCKAEGINKIRTIVHSENENMLSLNEKLGYEVKRVYMEKIIN